MTVYWLKGLGYSIKPKLDEFCSKHKDILIHWESQPHRCLCLDDITEKNKKEILSFIKQEFNIVPKITKRSNVSLAKKEIKMFLYLESMKPFVFEASKSELQGKIDVVNKKYKVSLTTEDFL